MDKTTIGQWKITKNETLRSMVKSVLWFGRKYVVEIRGSVAKVPIERTSEKNALEESVLSSFDRSCCGAVWLCM